MKPKMVFSFMDQCVLFPTLALSAGAFVWATPAAFAVANSCIEDAFANCSSMQGYGQYQCVPRIADINGNTYSVACEIPLNGMLYACPGITDVSRCSLTNPAPPPSTPPNVQTSQQSCFKGSIVQADSQVLGESVPVVGTSLSLNYSTNRVPGRTIDYSLKTPLTGSSVPSDVQGNTVELSYLGKSETYTINTLNAWQSFDWVWDGKDQNGNFYPGSAYVSIMIGTTSNTHPMDWPLFYSQTVGSYKAIVAGLGGWTISPHHFLDIFRGRIYMGDGTSRDVVVRPSDNNAHNWVMSEDGSEIYVFDLDGKHLYTKQALTGAVLYTFAYDTQGRLASVTDAYSNVTQIQRDTNGNLVGILAPHGQVTQLTLGSDGYLSAIQNPSNETYAMTYYAGGLLHTFQKPRGQVSTFTYDSLGRLISDSSSAGSALNLVIGDYDQQQGTQNLQVSTAMNRTTSYALNQINGKMGRIVTDPDGTLSNFQLDSNGSTDAYAYNYKLRMNEAFDWDPRFGQTFKYRSVANIYNYDAFVSGSVRNSKVLNGGTSDPFSFTSLNETIHYNDYDWQSVYTPADLKTTITSPLGRVYSYTMDSYGKTVSSKLASYAPVQFTYDPNGRLSTVTQSSRANTIQYDTNGYVSSVANALNQAVTYSRDNSGRVLTTTLPDSRVLTFTYDSNGNMTSLTPASSNQHYMGWNDFDMLSSYTPPVLNSTATPTSYSYNNDKQLTQIQRPNGNVVALNYDPTQGNLSSIVLPSGTYSYTVSAGRITSAQSPDAVKNTLGYAANQMSEDQLMNSSGQFVGKISHKNSYNLASPNSTDFSPTYTRASSAYSNELDTINYAYDHDSNLIQSGDEILSRDANTAFLTGTSLFNVADSYSYDSTYGELASYSATYNPGTRKKSKRKARTLVPLISQSFTRDALGRIATKAETVGSGSSNTYAYTYDSAGRLTDVSLNGSAASHYGYDSNSNRTLETIGGSSVSPTYDSQDRLLTYGTKTFGYNLNGERTLMSDSSLPIGAQSTSYTYDALGNLKQVVTPTQTVTYQMDGLNRRGSKSVGGVLQAQYLYEDQFRIGAVLDGAGHLAMHFAYGSKTNVPDYIVKLTGEKFKILSDQNGSVRLVVNSSTGTLVQQLDYDEFGKVINDTNPGFQPFGFAGGLYDSETGLTHFGARDYDASVGRWLQKDPILLAGGDTNLYGYILQDPINFVDPNGHFAQLIAAPIAGGIVGGLVSGIGTALQGGSLMQVAQSTVIGAAGGAVAGLGLVTGLGTVGATLLGIGTSTLSAVDILGNDFSNQVQFFNHKNVLNQQTQNSCGGN